MLFRYGGWDFAGSGIEPDAGRGRLARDRDLAGKLIYAARLCRTLRARHLLDHGLYAGQDVLLKSLAANDGQSMGLNRTGFAGGSNS